MFILPPPQDIKWFTPYSKKQQFVTACSCSEGRRPDADRVWTMIREVWLRHKPLLLLYNIVNSSSIKPAAFYKGVFDTTSLSSVFSILQMRRLQMLQVSHGLLGRNMSTQTVRISEHMELKQTAVDKAIPGKKPLVVLLGWLGATGKSLEKFHPFYTRQNCDILTIRPQAYHFLWPPKASILTRDLLEYLKSNHTNKPIIVHGFSIGCYVYSMLLLHLAHSSQYADVKEQIQGQVFDSVVIGGLKQMTIGVSKSIHPNALVRALIENTLMAYFSVTRNVTVNTFDEAIDIFKNSPVKAPCQFFYSLDDPMCDPDTLKLAMESLEKQGNLVFAKCWPKSGHTLHLKNHPKEYEETLNSFLSTQKLTVGTIMSKL